VRFRARRVACTWASGNRDGFMRVRVAGIWHHHGQRGKRGGRRRDRQNRTTCARRVQGDVTATSPQARLTVGNTLDRGSTKRYPSR